MSASSGPTAGSSPEPSPAASSIESSLASAGSSSEPAPEPDGSMLGYAPVSSVTAEPNNAQCDEGLAYSCGDTGPGGGVVFYASSTAFGCGPGAASSCTFLEVAPNGWNGTKLDCPNGCGGSPAKTSDYGSKGIGTGRGYHYCSGMGEKNLIPDASSQAIGAGYANTRSMVANCVSGDAGQLAQSYAGGGVGGLVPAVTERIERPVLLPESGCHRRLLSQHVLELDPGRQPKLGEVGVPHVLQQRDESRRAQVGHLRRTSGAGLLNLPQRGFVPAPPAA